MTESRLILTPSSEDDGSHLICRVKNALIPGAVVEDSVKLDVHCKRTFSFIPCLFLVLPIYFYTLMDTSDGKSF